MKVISFISNIRRTLLIILLLVMTALTEPDANAQGLYSHNKTASEKETGGDSNTNDNSSDRLFRAGSTENPTDSGQANKISPLKDGWGILLIAGIGYGFCITRWKRTKN
jgi:hypothetical protein